MRAGRSTDSFKLARGEYPDERCFSVIYVEGNKFKTLDLVAMSDVDANAWVQGLKMLVKEEGRSCDCQVVCHVTELGCHGYNCFCSSVSRVVVNDIHLKRWV